MAMLAIVMLLALSAAVDAPPPAPPPLAPLRTLRVDYVHSGKAGDERFALDGVALEGPWPGRPDRLLDQSGLGKYRFEVKGEGGRVLFSRAFASIYGEWEGTAEAKTVPRAFHESVRFPAPTTPVRVVISGRGEDGLFKERWAVPVDPASPLVDRAPSPAAGRVWAVVENGPPADKVDLLLLGDGYTPADLDKWHRDAQRMAELLFAVSPFKEHRADFNLWAIDTPSTLTGVSRPSDGVYRHTPIGATYDAFGSERYVLTFDNKKMREIAAAAPYEFVEIVVNDRKYGGGGIHNLYATVAADSAWAPYLFVHEFGHHFAGLADEYYTSPTSYEPSRGRPEPWEPNATADAKAGKWRDLITQGIAPPTPWPKTEFEAAQRDFQARRRAIRAEKRPEEEMDALFREERDWTTRLLAPFAGKVGAFERDVRGDRVLPPAGGLHHVHARRGGLLRGMPAGHRARHRHVRAGRGGQSLIRRRWLTAAAAAAIMDESDVRGSPSERGIRVPERSLQAYYPELARIGAETRIEAGGILWREGEGGRNRVVASAAEEATAGATSHFS